jgi:acetyl-CoA C-acetyltransferase
VNPTSDAFLLSAGRTPIGKYVGTLSEVPAPQLGAVALAEAMRRAGAKPDQIDEEIMGCVVLAGMGQSPTRQAALKAGLPDSIAAYTVNNACGSGLKTVILAAQAIRAGGLAFQPYATYSQLYEPSSYRSISA